MQPAQAVMLLVRLKRPCYDEDAYSSTHTHTCHFEGLARLFTLDALDVIHLLLKGVQPVMDEHGMGHLGVQHSQQAAATRSGQPDNSSSQD
jgi:hypothetical protein